MLEPPAAPKLHCVSLACRVIHEHFGKLPAVVAEVLLRKGRQTFSELLRNINSGARSSRQLHLASSSNAGGQQGPTMTAGQLKQVLLVLIQQNCITIRQQPAEDMYNGRRPAMHIYEADLEQMLQLIRRPKFLQHIRDESAANPNRKSDADALIVEALLEHGRLRYDQIVQAVLTRMPNAAIKTEHNDAGAAADTADTAAAAAAAAGSSADAAGLGTSTPSTMIWWAFLQLLQERYIERAPPCNLPPLPPTSAGVRPKKAAPKPGTAEYAEAQIKLMHLQQHKDFEESRFRAPSELAPNAKSETDDAAVVPSDGGAVAAAAAAMAAAVAATTQPSRKRRKTAGGMTADDAAAAAAAETLATAADTAAAARAAAALARKRRKTNTGGTVAAAAAAAAAAADDGAAAVNGVHVKQEDEGEASTAAAAARNGKADSTPEVDPPSAGEVLWRINTEEFNRRFRNKELVKLASEKLGQDAGSVLAAMLAHAGRSETVVNTEVTQEMSVGDIMGARTAAQESGRLPPLRDDTTVQDQVKALAWDSLECVDVCKPGPLGDTYAVNIFNLVAKLRLQQLNRVLLDKFGMLGMRVFNTLLLHGQLEPKQIADYIMREHKETRELLYRMFKAGYLQMQDIPKSAERAPSRCFYTFKADIGITVARLVADMYQAADNLHARLTHELSRHVEMLELVEAAQAAGHMVFNMTAGQRRSLEHLQKVTNSLHLSLLQTDGMLALFNEY